MSDINIEQLFTPTQSVATPTTNVTQLALFDERTDWEPVFKRVHKSPTATWWQRELVALLVQHLDTEEWTIINIAQLRARMNQSISREKLTETFAMLIEKGFLIRGDKYGNAHAYKLGKPQQPGEPAPPTLTDQI